MRAHMIFSVFLILFLFTFTSGAERIEYRELTLKECVFFALNNNLGVRIELLNPEKADMDIQGAREKFLPQLNFDFEGRNTNSTSYSWIQASQVVAEAYHNYVAQINQRLPTGGQLSLSLNMNKTDSNQKFQNINPRYGSTLSFELTQPLLRNFGLKISRRDILAAKNAKAISDCTFKQVLMDTVYSVEEAYWNLVFSMEILQVRKQSLDLAKDLLQKNKREIEIGTLAPKEILGAQAEVAAREADILQAEAEVRNNTDRLKTLINLPNGDLIADIIPVDNPSSEKREMHLEEALLTARDSRPDLQSLRAALENIKLDLSYARNQLLPGLDFNARYWSPGMSGDQIIYLDDNPLSEIVLRKIPGGVNEALKDATGFKYKNWRIYLSLDVPLNTVFTRAAVARARASLEQAELNIRFQEQQAALKIKNALRSVETDYRRVHAYRVARELADEKLKTEEAKLKVGLSTNFLVLQYQRDLSNARGNELRAIVDYNLSLSRLDRETGKSLDRWKIVTGDPF